LTLLLRLLRLPLPDAVKSRVLGELFAATADGFGRLPPELSGLPFDERLRRYAVFTSDEAERCLCDQRDVDSVRERLHGNARRLGERLRPVLRITGIDEALGAGRALYRIIGIDLEPGAHGEITISSCYFAGFYSAAVCGLISALDEGLFEGLTGGGRLEFYERMTEGCETCRARLTVQAAAR
jgi:hypothetical protein